MWVRRRAKTAAVEAEEDTKRHLRKVDAVIHEETSQGDVSPDEEEGEEDEKPLVVVDEEGDEEQYDGEEEDEEE